CLGLATLPAGEGIRFVFLRPFFNVFSPSVIIEWIRLVGIVRFPLPDCLLDVLDCMLVSGTLCRAVILGERIGMFFPPLSQMFYPLGRDTIFVENDVGCG